MKETKAVPSGEKEGRLGQVILQKEGIQEEKAYSFGGDGAAGEKGTVGRTMSRSRWS